MAPLAIFQEFGPTEIIILLLLALVLFGGKKLPEIGRSLGRGIKEFKGGIKGLGDDVRQGMESDDKAAGDKAAAKPKDAAKDPVAKDSADGK